VSKDPSKVEAEHYGIIDDGIDDEGIHAALMQI